MTEPLQPIVAALRRLPAAGEPGAAAGEDERHRRDAEAMAAVAEAFLAALGDDDETARTAAASALDRPPADSAADIAALFREGLALVREESRTRAGDAPLADRLATAARTLAASDDDDARREAIWSVLFPQGAGVLGHEAEREAALRARRRVRLEALADPPITDPAREVLFTSNVLLTVPLSDEAWERLAAVGLAERLEPGEVGPQQEWYDHPIPLGTEPEGNELLHGLRGLDEAIEFEARQGHAGGGTLPVVLSVSVTHDRLRPIARAYVEAELRAAGGLRHLEPYVITETEARQLADEVLAPAAERYLGADRSPFAVLGVDGPYGRHYAFLKAVAALWHVLVDPAVRATFKIDLDQVFPQEALVAETGRSAFGHLANPAWGGRGRDTAGHAVNLGMIAGSLVNARDADTGLFTPDVPPARPPKAAHEWVFHKGLPQAVSTRGEIVARADGEVAGGERTVLERIHVTGGTNGIRVDALRRHRPFVPSFVGRAEDQAYILSVLGAPGPRLAYLHASGLVMRHDKEAYARAAIDAAEVGTLVGDDVRVLLFSAYVDLLEARAAGREDALDGPAIRALLDPFTGAFASRLPATVVLLRFALRIRDWAATAPAHRLRELARDGSRRLREALELVRDPAAFAAAIDAERAQWDRLYATLDALEAGIAARDGEALALRDRARAILAGCRVR